MRTRRNTLRTWSVLVVTIAILAGTGVFFAFPQPESRSVASSDALVRIDGAWSPEGSPPTIVRQDPIGPSIVLRGYAYKIAAPPSPSDTPYRLTFTIPADVHAAPALYRFNSSLGVWQITPATVSVDGWTLGLMVDRLPVALWGVGPRVLSGKPERAPIILSELLAIPPLGAVGYQAVDARAHAAGDAVLLSDPLDAGGCGGLFRRGSSQTKTSRDIPDGEAIYRVIVQWQIGEGCAPGEQISSARTGNSL